MKKVFVFLFVLFLSAIMLMPMEAGAGVLFDSWFRSCDVPSNAEMNNYKKLMEHLADPNISVDKRLKIREVFYKGGNYDEIEIKEGYNYYADPNRYSVENCNSIATDIVLSAKKVCNEICENAGCTKSGDCSKSKKQASAKKECRQCDTEFDALKAQYDYDTKKGREETEEKLQDSCGRSKVITWVAIGAAAVSGGAAVAGALAGGAALALIGGAIGGGTAALGGAWLASKAGTAIYAGILAVFLSYHDGCWTCPIFDTVYNTGNDLAAKLYSPLRDVALALLAIFAFAWTLFQVLKFVTTLHAPNIGEFLTRIFKTLGLVAIMAAFLPADSSFLTGYFVDAPSLMALDLTDKILQAGNMGGDVMHYQTYTQDPTNDKCAGVDYGYNYTANDHTVNLCPPSNPANYAGKPMSATLHDRLICLLKKVSVRLIKGIAMGATFIVASFTAGWQGIIPDFSMFVVGILVFCCYFSLFFKIPIHLIDIVLRLCFLVITLPIYVICFPFPSTRGYTKKAWEMLLSLLVHIISLCIFVALALALIEQALA